MVSRGRLVQLVAMCLLTLQSSTAPALATLPVSAPSSSPGQERLVQADTLAARKAAVQAQIEALGPPGAANEGQDESRALLEQVLLTLTAFEDTLQKRARYAAQLEEVPQHLQKLEAENEARASRSPRRFPQTTEQLRDQYQEQLQATQAEIQALLKQTAAGESRLATIPRELEQRSQDRVQLEKDLRVARRHAAHSRPQTLPRLQVELLEWQLQLQRAEAETLEAERTWLIKRVPLQDARLKAARIHLRNLQQDLDVIKQTLSQTIQQEQVNLKDRATNIVQQMAQATDPAEALTLKVRLETVGIRRATADYRQQLNDLSDEVLAQERKNARARQNVERLAALVEKYSGGEVIAQRLLVIFGRLQRERAQYNPMLVTQLQERLSTLNERLFVLEDKLYEFDRESETHLSQLKAAFPDTLPTPQRDTAVAEMRTLYDEQKAAWRDQQQVLTALVQEMTQLIGLQEGYQYQLDDSYVFALTKIFWLRDSAPLSWNVGRDMLASMATSLVRLYAFARHQHTRWQAALAHPVRFGLVALLVLVILPAIAYRARKRLRTLVVSFFDEPTRRDEPPGGAAASFIVLRSAIWPAYLALVAWLPGQFFPGYVDQSDRALLNGVQLSALVLWIGLLGHGIFRRKGWARYYWGLPLDQCRSLQHAVFVGVVATLLCLVPRHILLTAPGDSTTAVGSLALARLLFMVFQAVTLMLVGIVGRRGGPLVQTVLAHSRQESGLVWRLWPFLHSVLVGGLATLLVLDMLGYRYAAQFLWSRILLSLGVIIILSLLLVSLLPHVLHRLVGALFAFFNNKQSFAFAQESTITRTFVVLRALANGLLVLLAVGVLLRVWGIPISWVVTSPTLSLVLLRTAVIALTAGLTLLMIRASRQLTHQLLEPRISRQGETREAGRKLKTLAPLVQTVIQVTVAFVSALVILEQVGVATGPVLAGVGIFGLAVGFASQSLIKDVINGLFILFEDSLSVGDVVMLHGIGGQVEKFTLRAVTLRDLSGNVHVIPNSSIDTVTNMTKEYSRYVLDVGVAYREDVDAVIGILREIDEEMRCDMEFGKDMLEPLEVLGLERFDDSAVIIRARLKTRPIQQWRIGREFNRRIKKVFDERGIEIPFPHQTLYWGVPKDGTQPPIAVVTTNHQLLSRE